VALFVHLGREATKQERPEDGEHQQVVAAEQVGVDGPKGGEVGPELELEDDVTVPTTKLTAKMCVQNRRNCSYTGSPVRMSFHVK